jgi:CRISPR/Cas system CMR-associated protein Cmr5 small subunit
LNAAQARASHAYTFVQSGLSNPSDFLQLTRKFPVLLQTNGLLAAWAYLLAKGGSAQDYARALAAHFREAPVALPALAPGDSAAILNAWTRLTGSQLRQLTAETLAYSTWLKRAAEAICDTGDNREAAP